MTTRRLFTDEFKQETVALLESSGRPLEHVAKELGIQPSMLRNWRRRPVGGKTASSWSWTRSRQAMISGGVDPLKPSPAGLRLRRLRA